MTNANEPICPITSVGFNAKTEDISFSGPGDFLANFKGLTKREYFAAMAMQGALANPEITKATLLSELPNIAVIAANILITELNKQP